MIKANDFLSDVKQNFKQREVAVTAIGGKEYKLLIDEKFSKSKIMNLITDMVDRANYCKTNDVKFDMSVCLWIMLLKYFTDIKFIEYKEIEKSYKNEIGVLQALIDLEIIEDIIGSFDLKEMNKITEIGKTFAEYVSYMHNVEVDQIIQKLESELPEDILVELEENES